MNIHIFYNIIGCCIILQLLYYIYHFYIEFRARKVLEKKLQRDRYIYEQYRYKYAKKHLKDLSDYELDLLLTFIKEEINKLPNKKDKAALSKTLNQKNKENQKSFAFRIMQESGLGQYLPVV